MWDLREGRLLYTLRSHTGAVLGGAFDESGESFATASEDKMVTLWKWKGAARQPEQRRQQATARPAAAPASRAPPPVPARTAPAPTAAGVEAFTRKMRALEGRLRASEDELAALQRE